MYAQIVEHFGGGWPTTFWSIGIVGLLWVPIWLALVPPGSLDDRPARRDALDAELDAAGVPSPAPSPTYDAASLIRRLIMLGLIVGSLNVSWQFLRAWLPLYLEDFHGYSKLDSRFAVSGYYIAAEVGCLLVGVLVMALVKRGRSVHGARVVAFAFYTALTALAATVPYLGSGLFMIAALMIAGAGILGLHPDLLLAQPGIAPPLHGLDLRPAGGLGMDLVEHVPDLDRRAHPGDAQLRCRARHRRARAPAGARGAVGAGEAGERPGVSRPSPGKTSPAHAWPFAYLHARRNATRSAKSWGVSC